MRGKLRIYLGPAPGVGKTFAMLDEGWRRRRRGADVVIGLVVTHGRPQTIAQIRDLEVVPPRTTVYRGSVWEELDVDAIVARRPQVVLVDELAHSNVPGSANEKRWQDIEQLLAAGIEVISTVNIQHLESVNDVVNRITGVVQRETVPDAVVRRADQVELVDMSPEALQRRMAHGNIYPPEKVDAALGNYFRLGNLGALRELALLWVADRVEDSLQDYMAQHGITSSWETRERVLVAVTGAPGGDDLIRRAARMARRTKGDLIGAHVVSSDGLTRTLPESLERHQRLLEELGGSWHTVTGDDVPATLVAFATAQHATQIVLGTSRRSRWTELTQGSIINRVVREAKGIDVHVIAADDLAAPRVRRRPMRVASTARGWRLIGAMLVLAVVALGALVAGKSALDARHAEAYLTAFAATALVAAVAVEQSARRQVEVLRSRTEADVVFALAERLARPNPPQVVVEEIRQTLNREAVALLAPDGDALVGRGGRRSASHHRRRRRRALRVARRSRARDDGSAVARGRTATRCRVAVVSRGDRRDVPPAGPRERGGEPVARQPAPRRVARGSESRPPHAARVDQGAHERMAGARRRLAGAPTPTSSCTRSTPRPIGSTSSSRTSST